MKKIKIFFLHVFSGKISSFYVCFCLLFCFLVSEDSHFCCFMHGNNCQYNILGLLVKLCIFWRYIFVFTHSLCGIVSTIFHCFINTFVYNFCGQRKESVLNCLLFKNKQISLHRKIQKSRQDILQIVLCYSLFPCLSFLNNTKKYNFITCTNFYSLGTNFPLQSFWLNPIQTGSIN